VKSYLLKEWRSAPIVILSFITLILGITITPYVYRGAPNGISAQISSDQKLDILELNSGRYQIRSKKFPKNIDFKLDTSPRFLIIRFSEFTKDYAFDLKLTSGKTSETVPIEGKDTFQHIIELPKKEFTSISLTSKRLVFNSSSEVFQIDEISFRESNEVFSPLRSWIHPEKLNRFLSLFVFVILFAALIIFYLFESPYKIVLFTTFFIVAAWTIGVSELNSIYYTNVGTISSDLRLWITPRMYECSDCNLSYGVRMAMQFLSGGGLTTDPGKISWARMPGYGIFTALVALITQTQNDRFHLTLNLIFFQLGFFAICVGLFFFYALKVFNRYAVFILTAIAILAPKQLGYSQVDSIMIAVFLLITASLCNFLANKKDNSLTLKHHILVHTSFAIWFLMRTDIVPAWFATSSLLYRLKGFRYYLLPIGLFLSIGLGWAIHKKPYTGEFSMTTNSFGASSFCGLWEIPHPFVWEPSDGSYVSWVEGQNLIPGTSNKANKFATREVARFYFTYPVYIISLGTHKFRHFIQSLSWAGLYSMLNIELAGQQLISYFRGSTIWMLLWIISAALIMNHQRERTLLLSWVLLFNLPIFLLVYASAGRFYPPHSMALLIVAVPILFEKDFYKKLRSNRPRSLFVLLVFVCLARAVPLLDKALLKNDGIRFYAPFLDPAKSTINVLKNQQSLKSDPANV
jgi:hypothetical protein